MCTLQNILSKTTNIIHTYLPEAQIADVEDAIQTACVKYLEKYNSLDNIAVSWLVRASINILIDTYRHDKKTCSLPGDIITKNDFISLVDTKLDSTSDVLKEICDELLYSEKCDENTG